MKALIAGWKKVKNFHWIMKKLLGSKRFSKFIFFMNFFSHREQEEEFQPVQIPKKQLKMTRRWAIRFLNCINGDSYDAHCMLKLFLCRPISRKLEEVVATRTCFVRIKKTKFNLGSHKEVSMGLGFQRTPTRSKDLEEVFIEVEKKVYRCVICDKQVSQKEKTNHVMRKHSAKLPSKCDHCGKTFVERRNMLSHVDRIHKGTRYQCNQCEKKFKSYFGAKRHLAKFHTQ